MTLRPEQLKAKQYLRDKGTSLPVARIHERVGAAFTALEAFLDGVTDAEARQRAMPREWSIQEVVDHLVETHRPSIGELRDLLANRRPPDGPVPASLQSADPMARTFLQLVNELKALHAEVLRALSSAPDQLTEARAPLVMVINAAGPDGGPGAPLHWIEELDWKAYAITAFRLHEIDHLNQSKRVLQALRAITTSL
jgi:DinB superfamily